MFFTGKRPIPDEIRQIVRRYRGPFLAVALLSALLNILVLGGSIYMMLVYDSVLPSHSTATLIGLMGMLIVVYGFQLMFDLMRGRILGHVGNSFDRALAHRVQRAMSERALHGGQGMDDGLTPMRDLESIRSFLAGPGPTTLLDLPWIFFFAIVLTLLHPLIGLTALVGGAVLIGLTFITNRVTQAPMGRLAAFSAVRNAQSEAQMRHVETLAALGMREQMLKRWEQTNVEYLAAHRTLARSLGTLGGLSRTGRILLQSVILTVGAWLVIRDEASGGIIFAASILSARALAPVDQAIANWRSLASARLGWMRLCNLLGQIPARPAVRTLLPAPCRDLRIQQIVVAPPGLSRPTVQGVDFHLKAGDGLAIIGPSAAGKSSLARAIVGIWRPVRGAVRLDGATIDQWSPELLGRSIGYLPQTVDLFTGTVAENIARFSDAPDPDAIIAAARTAGVHDMIVRLPQGYDTPVGADGRQLSGGQQQRIALARALYGDPFLLLLDEPNSNLDAEGDMALEQAITSVRLRGGIVIVISHRPTALARVNLALFLRDGRMEAFGPRDEVLRRVTARPATPEIVSHPSVDQASVPSPQRAAGGKGE